MKIKLFICLIIPLLLGSCKAPYYVPSTKHIGIERHGSQIIVQPFEDEKVRGEFIAIKEDMFIILGDDTGNMYSIPRENIKKVKIRYAQPKQYGWAIPVSIVSTIISHGLYLVLSAPVNALVTGVVTGTGASDFTYNNKTMSDNEIRMFARFPQGIPEGIELIDIARGNLIKLEDTQNR